MRVLLMLAVFSLAAPALAQEPIEGPVDDDDEEEEIRPVVAFSGPHMRLGFHLGAGAVLNDPRWGGFGALDVVLGARVAKEWSVIGRLDLALGGWDSQGPRFTKAVGGGVGVEHIAFRIFGAGTALALSATGGVWLPDECRSDTCLFFAPMLDLSAAYLTNMSYEPANPLAAWSIGLSAGIGYDVANEELAGRLVFSVGHDVSF